MRKFDTGATRDTDDTKLNYEGFLSPRVLQAYAEYMHRNRIQADGEQRDADNWQKGIPQQGYMESAFRHFVAMWAKHRGGMPVGDEAYALLFNIMGYMHEETRPDKKQMSAHDLARLKLMFGMMMTPPDGSS